MKIKYSAPGKVILSGEHAVVYGKPAIVAAIDKRLYFGVVKFKKKTSDENIKVIIQIVTSFLKSQKKFVNKSDYSVEVKSDIYTGRGLGSSAALAVAGTACFLEFFSGEKFDRETINNLSFKIEKKFHQNPSGVDNTVSTFGGLIYFRREFEFLKSIFKLPFKMSAKIEDCLYLIDSGKPKESTGQMVLQVGTFYNKKPKSVEKIFQQIEKTTKRLTLSLVKEDSSLFHDALVDNQKFLEGLGVVSKKAEHLLMDLKKFGAGKITGGGGRMAGSGFLLFYSKEKNKLTSYLESKKISYIKFKQSNQGVVKETI